MKGGILNAQHVFLHETVQGICMESRCEPDHYLWLLNANSENHIELQIYMAEVGYAASNQFNIR